MICISKVIHTILSLTDNITKNITPAIMSMRKMQGEYKQAKEELKKHEKAQTNAMASLEKAKEAVKNVSSSVLQNSQAYQTATAAIKRLEERNSTIAATIAEHKTSLSGLQQAYLSNQAALKAAQTALKEIKAEHGNGSEAAKAQENEVEKLKESYTASLTAYKEAKKAISELQSEQRGNTDAIKAQKTAVEQLKSEILKNSSAVKIAEANVKKYEKQIDEAKNSAQAAKVKINSLSAAVAKNKKAYDEAKQAAKEWDKNIISSIDSALVGAAKWGAVTAAATGGLAIKTGFETAFNLEAYRTQLETATKDTQKAGKLMRMATDLSNTTPFTSQETIQATAAMEAYGVSSEKWLRRVADMAGATNKEMEQATNAVIDVLTKGEYQGIEEFGIDKNQIMEKANEMFGKNKVFKKSGEIRKGRENDVQAVLEALMTTKFDGGADKLSKTVRGLWSTITGITSDSLAKIFGMENGVVKSGSALDLLKKKLENVANVLTKWQQDGTIDYIAERFTEGMQQAIEATSKLFNFIKENIGAIKTIAKLAAGFYIAAKAVIFLSATISALQIIMTLLSANPVGLGIIAAVAAVWLLIKAVKIVISWVKNCWDKMKEFADGLPDWATALLTIVSPIFTTIKMFQKLSDVVGSVWKKIKGFFSSDEEKNISINENIANPDALTNEQLKEIEKDPKRYLRKLTNQNQTPAQMLKEMSDDTKTKATQTQRNSKVGTTEKTIIKQSSPKITIEVKGDIYGYDDFKEKVMGAFAELVKYDLQNVT